MQAFSPQRWNDGLKPKRAFIFTDAKVRSSTPQPDNDQPRTQGGCWKGLAPNALRGERRSTTALLKLGETNFAYARKLVTPALNGCWSCRMPSMGSSNFTGTGSRLRQLNMELNMVIDDRALPARS